jgi:hypothetical protein
MSAYQQLSDESIIFFFGILFALSPFILPTCLRGLFKIARFINLFFSFLVQKVASFGIIRMYKGGATHGATKTKRNQH